MTAPIPRQLIEVLARVIELSPDVRFGQLLTNIEFLVNDRSEQPLGEIDDDDLLAILDEHRRDLLARSTTGG